MFRKSNLSFVCSHPRIANHKMKEYFGGIYEAQTVFAQKTFGACLLKYSYEAITIFLGSQLSNISFALCTVASLVQIESRILNNLRSNIE